RSAPDAYRSASPARCARHGQTPRQPPRHPHPPNRALYCPARPARSPVHPLPSHVPHSAPRQVDRTGHRLLRLRLALDKASWRSNRDRLPDVAYALRGEYGHRGLKHRLAVATIEGGNRRNAADVVRREVAARDHGDDAGHPCRVRNVDFTNNRMRNRGARECGMHLTCDIQVVSEFSATLDEGCILPANPVPLAAT